MAFGDIYKATIMGTLHGQTIQNIYWYREVVNGGASASLDLATLIGSNLGLAFKQNLSQEYTYVGTQVQRIFPDPPLGPVVYTTGAGTGSIAQNSLPTVCAATITKRTLYAGRKYRGRSFIAGIPVTYETDSNINATGLTNLGNIASSMIQVLSGLGSGQYAPVLMHTPLGHVNFDAILAAEVRVPIRVQRRREVGRGV